MQLEWHKYGMQGIRCLCMTISADFRFKVLFGRYLDGTLGNAVSGPRCVTVLKGRSMWQRAWRLRFNGLEDGQLP